MPIVDNLNGNKVPKVISQSPSAQNPDNQPVTIDTQPDFIPRSVVRKKPVDTNNKVLQSNGVANYSSAPKPQVVNNQYNDLIAQQALARKQSEQINKSVNTSERGLLGDFNFFSNLSIPINEKYDSQFLNDPEYQHLAKSSMNKRLATRAIARQSMSAALKASGLQIQEQTEAQLRERKLNSMLLSGGNGAITNTGLRFGLKSEGVKFIDALRINNRVTIDELAKLHATNILEADDEADKMLSQYIEIERGKKKAEAIALVKSGRIAQLDDKSILLMAQEAGIPEITMLTIKSSILDQQNPQSAKIVEREISKIRSEYSPPGFKINGVNRIGGHIDENGVYRFEQPKPTDKTANGNPMQWCAGFVNSAIGTNIGSLYTDKEKHITSQHPIPYGFFIEKNGIIDKETGLNYGHTGLVEVVSEDGNTIQIAESNYDGKMGFRRITLHKRGDGKWVSSDGRVVKNITGFGKGNIEADDQDELKSEDPIVQKNYEVVQQWSNSKAPSQLPQFDLGLRSDTGIKTKLGISGDTLIDLANSAKISGGYANAVMIDFFNENKIQLPQALLDVAPRDKLEMVKTMADLYRVDVPAGTYKNIINAGIVDDEMSAQLSPFASDYANATKEREYASAQKAQNDYNLQAQQHEERIQKIKSDEAIAANKLLYKEKEAERKEKEKGPVSYQSFLDDVWIGDDDKDILDKLKFAYDRINSTSDENEKQSILDNINKETDNQFSSADEILRITNKFYSDNQIKYDYINGASLDSVKAAKMFLSKGGSPKQVPVDVLEEVYKDDKFKTQEISNILENKESIQLNINPDNFRKTLK